MKKFIVKTSDLGYTIDVYQVVTTLPLSKFLEIDMKYGMKYRHQSTSIKDLEKGAIAEGYQFEYKPLVIKDNSRSEHRKYKEDYFARYGNY